MAELATLLLIITLSLLVVRAGALALAKTGLSMDVSTFQSQSAFMGVGFTTTEAESVVSHPVRRRIVSVLMMLGFGAITSTLGTLVLTFARAEDNVGTLTKLEVLAGGLAVLWIGRKIRPVERLLDRVITRALETMTDLDVLDYEELLMLNKGYTVGQIHVEEGTWIAGHTLHHLELASEGVLVLSITRENDRVVGTPSSSTPLLPGDRLLCYALGGALTHLAKRPAGEAGDEEHRLNVRQQRLRLVEERVEDRVRSGEELESP